MAATGWEALLRNAILGAMAILFACPSARGEEPQRPLRLGLTATYLYDLFSVHERLRLYMEQRLNRRVEFVRRDSYREAVDMLLQKKIDFAWICDYPYADNRDRIDLVAVPVYQGRSYYRSYLIVPASDLRTQSVLQLKGAVFAYTDPYSNTGYLTPRFQIRQGGENPAEFFGKSFFTRSHRKVVEAVAAGLADGGAVGSFIWDTLAIIEPRLTATTRIAWTSPEYGFPPIVAHPSVPEGDRSAMQALLVGMAGDAEGKALLAQLNLDGFIPGDPGLYDRVTTIMRALGEQ